MTREQAFTVWTPDDSPWSPWTKAVLFAFLPGEVSDIPAPPLQLRWRAVLDADTAVVVEALGAEGIGLGVALARSGYRPIPLYNACPHSPLDELCRNDAPAVVAVEPTVRALADETPTLRSIPLPPAAPPAFLLDADRLGHWFSPPPGWFDNRSTVRDTDVPSAEFLRGRGVRQVVVVRSETKLPRDLRVVLQRWQEGGLNLSTQVPGARWDPQLLVLPRSSLLARWWDRTLVALRCRPRHDGSFGRTVTGRGMTAGGG